jgi:hypothetical protein
MLCTSSDGQSSRRSLLRTASGAGLLAFFNSFAFGASDFWNRKEASSWSEEEREQLKTKSPWAKKTRAELTGGGGGRGRGIESMDSGGSKGTFGGMSGADSNGIREGGGRGGRGGGRGGDIEGGSAPQGPEVVVRWENAPPVLEATKLKLPADLVDHYAISITGLPPQMLAAILAGGRGRGEGAPPEAAQPEDPAERQKAMLDRLLHSVTLTAKGRDPQGADLMRQAFNNQTLIFGFAKQGFPLSPTDKDVQFQLKLGALTVKAKFEPKEMTYKGVLAL